MAVIVKANLVTDVNANLQVSLSVDQLDRAIIKTLTDMSNRGLLVGTDETQTLAAGGYTLEHPAGCRSVISITLTDASGNVKEPLTKFKGGHRECRQFRALYTRTGEPESFSDFNKQFLLWPTASEAFTTLIEFRKNHAKTADAIEFTTELESVMCAGATFWYAAEKNRTKSIATWWPIYQGQLNLAALSSNTQPSIIRS